MAGREFEGKVGVGATERVTDAWAERMRPRLLAEADGTLRTQDPTPAARQELRDHIGVIGRRPVTSRA